MVCSIKSIAVNGVFDQINSSNDRYVAYAVWGCVDRAAIRLQTTSYRLCYRAMRDIDPNRNCAVNVVSGEQHRPRIASDVQMARSSKIVHVDDASDLVENHVTAPLNRQGQTAAALEVWMLVVGGIVMARSLITLARPGKSG
jgi:hypothetical protein